MYSDAGAALYALKFRFFVLWDTNDDRGWLVPGPVAALQVLRSYIKNRENDQEADFDFSKLNHINSETPSAAYDLLHDKDNKKVVVFTRSEDVKEKPKAGESSADVKEVPFEHVAFNVYKVLLQLSKITIETSDKSGNNIPDWFYTWIGRRWDYTVRGWDFRRICHSYEPQVYLKKFHTDPGWLDLTRGLKACFLFGGSFGEIMKPRDGHCCPYFKTLPVGENYLAVGMGTIQMCVNEEGRTEEATETVAKLAPEVAWERDVNPFSHVHGQGGHLDKVDPSCFPVQRAVRVRHTGDKKKDRDLLIKSKGRLYSWKDVDDMNTAADDTNKKTRDKPVKTGVVVFGNKPDGPKLRQLAEANASVAVATPSKTPTQQPQAGATRRPPSSKSLRSNAPATDARGSEIPTKSSAQPSATPAGKAPSVTSIRSTDLSPQRKAPVTGPGVERPQGSAPHASTASAQRTPSVSSVKSTASNTHPRAPSTATGTGQPRTSSPQTLANSTHKTASNASLRSAGSNNHPRAAIAGSGRPGESSGSGRPGVSTADPSALAAARKPSSSSVRTTGSVDSKATGGSSPQVPAGQLPVPPPTLKKTTTDASDKTTSSRASRSTQSSAAGSTSSNNRQKQQQEQQRLRQLGAATAAAVVTEGHHTTSSGPAPTAGGGQDG